MGMSINDITHLLRGEGGSAKRWHYSIVKCPRWLKGHSSEKRGCGEGGVKILKKWVMSFMDGDGPYTEYF